MRYQKSILTLLCIVYAVSQGTAQTKTLIGLKAGGGVSTIFMAHTLFPINAEVGIIPTVHAGIVFVHFPNTYDLAVNAGIQLGINYVQKGWSQSFPFTDTPDHVTRIDYIEVPLEAFGYLGNQNKYYLSAGIFVQQAIYRQVDAAPADVGFSDFFLYDFNKDRRLGYGPRASAGAFRELNNGQTLKLEAYFTMNIRSVYDFEPITSGVPDQALTFSFGASVAYLFSFGDLKI